MTGSKPKLLGKIVWVSIQGQCRGLITLVNTKLWLLGSFNLIILIRSLDFLVQIQVMINNYPSKSISSLAKDIRLSQFLIRLVVYKDICYFSYKIREGQFSYLIFQVFCQDYMLNSKNKHWLALSPHDLLIMIKTKRQIHIMIFAMVTSDSELMPSFIFPLGLRLNLEAYIIYLSELVLTWIDRTLPFVNSSAVVRIWDFK